MKAKNLKEIRINKNLIQKDLAEMCNISGSYYSLIEKGLRNPSIDTAKSIADSLGITLDVFYYALQHTKNPNIEIHEDLITERQLKYIHLLANEKAIDPDSIKNYLKKTLNKDSTKDLTKDEASKLITILKKVAGGKHV